MYSEPFNLFRLAAEKYPSQREIRLWTEEDDNNNNNTQYTHRANIYTFSLFAEYLRMSYGTRRCECAIQEINETQSISRELPRSERI